jgi:hypothetical protein
MACILSLNIQITGGSNNIKGHGLIAHDLAFHYYEKKITTFTDDISLGINLSIKR